MNNIHGKKTQNKIPGYSIKYNFIYFINKHIKIQLQNLRFK